MAYHQVSITSVVFALSSHKLPAVDSLPLTFVDVLLLVFLFPSLFPLPLVCENGHSINVTRLCCRRTSIESLVLPFPSLRQNSAYSSRLLENSIRRVSLSRSACSSTALDFQKTFFKNCESMQIFVSLEPSWEQRF